MNDLILERLQADALGMLKACPTLATAEIISANDGDVEAEVLRKLSPLTGALRGLALVVMLPDLDAAERNGPGPLMDAILEVQVIEAVLVNRGTGGTGIRCTTACLRALGVLHHLRIANTALYADKKPMEPLPGKKGYVSYVIRLYAQDISAGVVAKVVAPTATMAGSDLTLSTPTAGASIYYTLDGTFPGSTNDAATLYAGPFTIAEAATLRAAAFAADMNPSDIIEATVTP